MCCFFIEYLLAIESVQFPMSDEVKMTKLNKFA